MPKPEKEQAVALLEERFKKSKSVVFASFQGLNSAQTVEMRREFRKNNVEYYVVKNTLANIAADRAGIKNAEAFFKGQTGVCIAYDDPAVAFRLAYQISKKFEKYKIKGGVYSLGFRLCPQDALGSPDLSFIKVVIFSLNIGLHGYSLYV